MEDQDRTTPIGLYNYGVAYLDTARAALGSSQRIRFFGPFEFLCAHALELIFKADLSRRESLEIVRKSYGHRLEQLYADVSDEFTQHFQLGDEFAQLVAYLASGHTSPHFESRYLRTGYKNAIEPRPLLDRLAMFNLDSRQWLLGHFGT